MKTKVEEHEQALKLTEHPEWRRRDVLLTVGATVAVGIVWLFFSPLVF